jgi:hypothetical protein
MRCADDVRASRINVASFIKCVLGLSQSLAASAPPPSSMIICDNLRTEYCHTAIVAGAWLNGSDVHESLSEVVVHDSTFDWQFIWVQSV